MLVLCTIGYLECDSVARLAGSRARGMIAAKAVGYLLKDEAPSVIIAAVRAAGKGEGWFSAKVAAQIAAWARGEQTERLGLTEREIEVLRLVVAGKANKEIALAVNISEKAVEKRLSELYAKLNVASRVEAAVLAVREGLV